ncbi:aminoglycoside 3'-phosphotransferase/choline kinase domain protein [Metarhizium robertsii]|uniref:Protein kinase-like protein n=2 Tax=Metarhizium robertsii TaxID=568076 RepID=E9EK53_METRA|nr:Protein kinase-like protein [Metarhizium robertsii ARSEF 23]EFZ03393.1 Protein kinase-like protein [Metarhizium robertsii ARSEF 23]EXU97599.1 aminoglycoside 3'-phosphotransferase/choline kinase domain protein [Metarhizium robertsii]
MTTAEDRGIGHCFWSKFLCTLVRRLEEWLLPIRMRLGRKIMYDEQRKIVQVSSRQLIKGPCSQQELEAMQYAASSTSVPLPRIHRTYQLRQGLFIAMDYIRGESLEDLWARLTDEEKRKAVAQVWDSVRQLHACRPPSGLGGMAAASVGGGPVRDGALGVEDDGPAGLGPFVESADFVSVVDERTDFAEFPRQPDQVAFVHADICPRNIIRAADGKLYLIDWEFAGWWPLYWERMKWHFADFPPMPDFIRLMDEFSAEESGKLSHSNGTLDSTRNGG